MSKEIVPGKNRGLGFGDVVLHSLRGPGMVYAVTSDGSLMIAFEEGCVCTGYQGLRYLGSIFDLEELMRSVKTEKPKGLPEV